MPTISVLLPNAPANPRDTLASTWEWASSAACCAQRSWQGLMRSRKVSEEKSFQGHRNGKCSVGHAGVSTGLHLCAVHRPEGDVGREGGRQERRGRGEVVIAAPNEFDKDGGSKPARE